MARRGPVSAFGSLSEGATFTQDFTEAGAYGCFRRIHAGMGGAVVVV